MERLEPTRVEVVFQSLSGPLTVRRSGARYVMDFPARPSQPVSLPAGLAEALGAVPVEIHLNSFNYLAVFENADVVRNLLPDINAIVQIDREGVIAPVRRRSLRLHKPLLRARQRHPRGSSDGWRALHAHSLLGAPAGQDGLSRLPGL